MTVIEADGVETNPHTVDSFEIFPSQRYSVVVHADQPVDNYCEHQLPPYLGDRNSLTFITRC